MAVAAVMVWLVFCALAIVAVGVVTNRLEARRTVEPTSPIQEFIALGELDHGFRPIGELAAPRQLPRQRCRICASAWHQGACE